MSVIKKRRNGVRIVSYLGKKNQVGSYLDTFRSFINLPRAQKVFLLIDLQYISLSFGYILLSRQKVKSLV